MGQMSLWGKFFCAQHDCSVWNIESNILVNNLILSIKSLIPLIKLKSNQRIGPHDFEVLSILIGSLLVDAYAERHGNGTRFCFQQEKLNSSYLIWFHEFLSERGYCNKTVPKLTTRIGKGGKIRYLSRFKSYTYSSFNWIHNIFYTFDKQKNKYIKILPKDIDLYLTPLALAVWFMVEGSKIGKSARIATNNFTYQEIEKLCKILEIKYNLKTSIHVAGKSKGYILYIHKSSMPTFSKIVKPYMLSSLYYKLGDY